MRGRESGPEGEVALRAEIESLRGKAREQALLIDRLQRQSGHGFALAAPGANAGAGTGSPESDHARAQRDIAEAEAAIQSVRAGAAEGDSAGAAYEREIHALRAGAQDQAGEIARRTDYEKDRPGGNVTRDGRYIVDTLPGEQALVYHLKGKGLVVLTACGHAGVVNTVLHAQEVTGVDRVHAVVGGFHLSGATAERIARTVDGLAELDPDLIIPMHCTGMATIEALRSRLPGRVIYNSAGTQYELGTA